MGLVEVGAAAADASLQRMQMIRAVAVVAAVVVEEADEDLLLQAQQNHWFAEREYHQHQTEVVVVHLESEDPWVDY
jgi:hypothetical protein